MIHPQALDTQRDAASRADKLLNTLVLASRFSRKLAPNRFDSAGVLSTTELTLISGLMSISPEGGP